MPISFDAIIWDWNGTLLDDTELCVTIMNGMLKKRDLPLLTVDSYQNIFTFPVKNYYQHIGFNFEAEPFEIPAKEFIDRYNEKVLECELHEQEKSILNHFQTNQIQQFVLSAMKQDALEKCLVSYSIDHFFEHISGLDDHYAVSKLDNGRLLFRKFNLNPDKTILIGDTVHDYEVASELRCQCVLIANGHQSKQRLESTGGLVINSLDELLSI
jgi:phosphoglycolate phosphatase